MMGKPGPVVAEFNRRRDAEQAKAVRKYGRDATLPAGRPDYDILDFTINELVGMVRYAQMNEARSKMMLDLMDGLTPATRQALRELVDKSRELEAMAGRYAFDLISIWQRLKLKGKLHLGATERAAL